MKTFITALCLLFCANEAFSMIDASAVERERTLRRDSILSLITGAAMPADSLLITDFGAKGDGVKDCKRAFDRAMRAAGKRGGAKIIVPEGVYLVKGPIHFVSNVCLDLEGDSQGQDNTADGKAYELGNIGCGNKPVKHIHGYVDERTEAECDGNLQ